MSSSLLQENPLLVDWCGMYRDRKKMVLKKPALPSSLGGGHQPQEHGEPIGLTEKEGMCLLIVLSHQKELIVYLGFSLWRKLLTLLAGSRSMWPKTTNEFHQDLIPPLCGGGQRGQCRSYKPTQLGLVGSLKHLTSGNVIAVEYLHDQRLSLEPSALNKMSSKYQKPPASDRFCSFFCGAVRNNIKDVVSLMLQTFANHGGGRDPAASSSPMGVHYGSIALFYAAELHSPMILQLLLQHGANAEMVMNYSGHSSNPLRAAIEAQMPENVAILVHQGGVHLETTPSLYAHDTHRALHFAAEGGQLEMVKLLLDLGADPSSRISAGGSTAIELARSRGYSEIVELLREKDPNHVLSC